MAASLRIEIFPSDLDRTINFYTALGFETTGHSEGPPEYASLRLGDVRIGALVSDHVERSHRAIPARTEIVIEVDDIHQYRDGLIEVGIDLAEHSPKNCRDAASLSTEQAR